ncbi:MAG: amino acid adenylation domain-containing protein, partial [Planctomycetota bacterium]
QRLTYGELRGRAGALAAALARGGVKPGDVVGVATARGPQLLVSLAGIHLAGAAHLPLDPSFPAARLRFMLEDSGAVGVVDADNLPDDALVEGLAAFDSAAATDFATEAALPAVGPDQLAYLIYTSGSTGQPKGVKVHHGALANLLASVAERPGLTAVDRLLAVTTISFDISLLELLAPLASGGCVVVASRDEAEDPAALERILREQAITVMQSTPATWRMLVELGWTGRSALRAFCGGERLPEDLAAELLPRVASLWNLYGPTETTIWSTVAEVSEAATASRVGKPIAGTQVLILDQAGNELPPGFPGEICIAGTGVSLGYHNRAQLTAERFVDHLTHGRYYRTGDRGRLRPDGSLECLGRDDQQVKLRGFRIELGEIESALAAHPDVTEAAVVVAGAAAHEQRLVAHVATGDADAPADLDQHLGERLPRYMLPHAVVAASELPHLPNGKLDRRALLERSAPAAVTDATGQGGDHPSEESHVIAQVMARLLGAEAFGPDLDFFMAGGHSLLAARLVTELNRSLSTALTLRDVFESPTPRTLSGVVGAARSKKVVSTAVARRADQTRAPVTQVQDRIWNMQQMRQDEAHYNLPSGHRLRGALDVTALRDALREVVQRHAALRAVFERVDGAVQMVVQPTAPETVLTVEDLSTAPESARGALLGQQLKATIARPFDLSEGPLFVAQLFRLSQEDHLLFFMPHHIIWDGWSFDVFYKEMAAIYAAYTEGRDHQLPPLPYSYGDFAAWHREVQGSPEVRAETESWRGRLEAFGAVTPLPTDRTRSSAMSGRGATEWIAVASEQTQSLHEVAQKQGATMFHVLLAAYTALLYEYGERERLLIATPLRGREAPGSEDLMGCCNSLLPLPFVVDPDAPFRQLLRQVQETATAGLAHSNVLLEDVALRRADRKTTLYQALFSFQDARERVRRWGSLHHEPVHLFQEAATEDLGLWFLEGVDGLFGGLTYNSDVLDKQTIERLRARMLEIFTGVIEDPEQPVSSLCRIRRDATADARGDRAGAADPELRDLPDAAGHSAYLLAAIWRRMLEVSSVGLRDDFFALGGDSLMAIRSINEFEEATGTRIDLGAFMSDPTVAGVAAHVAAGAQKTASAVVPLQHLGDGGPMFCLLGVGIYRHFAVSLGPHQPVYGVYTAEEDVLSGDADAMREGAIDRLASAYVEILKAELREPRLQLAGLSMGGVIAMEVARRMAAQGYAVERVVLFDTILPSGYRKDWWTYLTGAPTALLRRARRVLPGPRADAQGAGAAAPDIQQRRTFRERIQSELPAWAGAFRAPPVPVHLCRATDTSSWGRHLIFDGDYGWKAVVGDRLQIVFCEGDHTSLLRPPNVEVLAQQLRQQMRGDA